MGYAWGVYEQNILKVIEPSKIIMAGWQWLDEAKPKVKGIADYKGYKKGPGPEFTLADKAAYGWWQKKNGYKGVDANGIPGPKTWTALKVPKA